MPVTEIDKKNQSLDQQSQSEQSQSQSQSQPSSSQSLQQQEDSQQLPDAEDIESTNNLIDSLTTQQQQEQLFNKLHNYISCAIKISCPMMKLHNHTSPITPPIMARCTTNFSTRNRNHNTTNITTNVTKHFHNNKISCYCRKTAQMV